MFRDAFASTNIWLIMLHDHLHCLVFKEHPAAFCDSHHSRLTCIILHEFRVDVNTFLKSFLKSFSHPRKFWFNCRSDVQGTRSVALRAPPLPEGEAYKENRHAFTWRSDFHGGGTEI